MQKIENFKKISILIEHNPILLSCLMTVLERILYIEYTIQERSIILGKGLVLRKHTTFVTEIQNNYSRNNYLAN